MSIVERTLVGIAYLLSALLMPWWFTVLIGVVLLSQGVYGIVLLGGVMMDFLFGSPQPILGNFSMIFTAVFTALALLGWGLHRRVLE